MLTEDNARALASHWIRAWNSHDLDEIMSHYGEDVVLVSCVTGNRLTIADFSIGGLLPTVERIALPVARFPEICRWYEGISVAPCVSSTGQRRLQPLALLRRPARLPGG